jgi:TPR repeat protein
MSLKHSVLSLLLISYASLAPADYATEDDDGNGVVNPSNYSKRYYWDQLARFPERTGLICYNAYLLDKTGLHSAGMEFFKACAERGNAPSMIHIASIYEQGVGVPRDYVASASWLRRAAEADYALGQLHYGVALLLGRGVPRDVVAGKHWIGLAAKQGEADALALLDANYDLRLVGEEPFPEQQEGFALPNAPLRESSENELSYDSWLDSDNRLKCMYGYLADKTGDHAAAIAIFEDCIERWNDVYSMIWLALIYETGIGVPRDQAYATALVKRGAMLDDEPGYSRLARYHYGVALVEGRGVAADAEAGKTWLRRARDEGVAEAAEYLDNLR